MATTKKITTKKTVKKIRKRTSAKLEVWDQRMFTLMDIQTNDVTGVMLKKDFLKSIGATNNTAFQVTAGKASFRHKHLYTACKKYGVSMDWFYGFTDKMKRESPKTKDEELVQLLTNALMIAKSKS